MYVVSITHINRPDSDGDVRLSNTHIFDVVEWMAMNGNVPWRNALSGPFSDVLLFLGSLALP